MVELKDTTLYRPAPSNVSEDVEFSYQSRPFVSFFANTALGPAGVIKHREGAGSELNPPPHLQ